MDDECGQNLRSIRNIVHFILIQLITSCSARAIPNFTYLLNLNL